MMSLKGVLEEIDKRVKTNHMKEIRQIQSLNANIKRIAAAPARHIQRTVVLNTISSLSSWPRTVYELWDEYTVGVGGRKPAREFTAHEQSQLKYKYYRRKIVWDLISNLISRTELAHHVVIDQIYQHYGRECSVTQIISKVRQDKKNHHVPPLLRLG